MDAPPPGCSVGTELPGESHGSTRAFELSLWDPSEEQISAYRAVRARKRLRVNMVSRRRAHKSVRLTHHDDLLGSAQLLAEPANMDLELRAGVASLHLIQRRVERARALHLRSVRPCARRLIRRWRASQVRRIDKINAI